MTNMNGSANKNIHPDYVFFTQLKSCLLLLTEPISINQKGHDCKDVCNIYFKVEKVAENVIPDILPIIHDGIKRHENKSWLKDVLATITAVKIPYDDLLKTQKLDTDNGNILEKAYKWLGIEMTTYEDTLFLPFGKHLKVATKPVEDWIDKSFFRALLLCIPYKIYETTLGVLYYLRELLTEISRTIFLPWLPPVWYVKKDCDQLKIKSYIVEKIGLINEFSKDLTMFAARAEIEAQSYIDSGEVVLESLRGKSELANKIIGSIIESRPDIGWTLQRLENELNILGSSEKCVGGLQKKDIAL